MKTILLFFAISLAFPRFLTAQEPRESDEVFVAEGYEDSPDAPIKISAGLVMRTAVDGYFINDHRYAFYRRLHEFATDEAFKGREREILDGFGSFLTESDDILLKMTENTSRLELSSERLKMAQNAVDDLNRQVDELARQNKALQSKINEPIRQKRKWVMPALIGAIAGLVGGVLLQ